MPKVFFKNIIYGNTYNCIELSNESPTEPYNYIALKIVRKEIEIINQKSFIHYNDLLNGLPKNKPHHLIINNEEVLYTKIKSSQTDLKTLVQEAYPNVRLEDFYFEGILGEYNHLFICRKSYINKHLKSFASHNLHITSWSLGFSSILSLRDILENRAIKSTNYHFEWSKSGLHAKKNENINNNNLNIEGLDLFSINVLRFSGALSSFIGKDRLVKNNFAIQEKELSSNYKQHRLFQIGLPAAICILLFLGILNTIIYTNYFNKVQHLTQLVELNKSQRESMRQQDSLVNSKQKLFEDVIKSTSSKSSFYLDRIFSTKPLNIKLNVCEFQPFEKRIRSNKAILLENNIISIVGEVHNNNDLSLWIQKLEQISFVKEIAIEQLLNDQDKNAFTIRVIIDDN